MIYFNQVSDTCIRLLAYNLPLLFSYSWYHCCSTSYCKLSIENTLTHTYSRIDAYAIISTQDYKDINTKYIVVNFDRIRGFQTAHIYQSNDDRTMLQVWLEKFVFTKESIQNIFKRLLKRDQYEILKTQNILSRKDAFNIAYDSEETDDDRI